MRHAGRILKWLGLAAAVALACLELAHWGDTRIDLVSEDTAMNLRQEPAAAITEGERAMMEELSAHPAIQELAEDGEGWMNVSEDPAVMAIVEGALGPEDASLAIVSVLSYGDGTALILNWRTDGGGTVLQRTETGYFKTYSRDGLFGRRMYENWDDETVRQSVAHHWWFSWLTADG